ncbi:N-formylglutamate amidohydrolase (plasmid) [Microvirga sp. RSM25]|uniref:N-formylglutamate amidohydrolase n=1 Tax=Microvirga sp. RSM25 TaxID=3273802 RepID=UPI00384F144E
MKKIHQPYHRRVANALDRFAAVGKKPILLAIHSFTRALRQTGDERECELGLLFNRDERFAKAMLTEVNASFPKIKASLNEPYTVDDLSDYSIPVHGERRGLPHVLIEIRNDLISNEAGQLLWADIISRTARAAAGRLGLEQNCSRSGSLPHV